LALYANNANEVSASNLLRPLILSMALAIALLVIGRPILRSWKRAGLAASLVLLLFGSYGHLYNLLKATEWLNPFARHRMIGPLYLLLLLAGLILIAWRPRRYNRLTVILNLCMALLLAFPLLQSAVGAVSAASRAQQAIQQPAPQPSLISPPGQLPSVYLIIMDTYTRSDTLLGDMQFDNSGFVNGLEGLGFSVPSCSRANYDFTQAALVATLNLDYLDSLERQVSGQGQEFNMTTLLKYSHVRQQLENLGYKTVAFDSGYEWSRLYDADTYLTLGKDNLAAQLLTPFELMLAKSSALRVVTDYLIYVEQSEFSLPSSQFNDHINLERYILARLPSLAEQDEPQFVFVHLLIPHWPYIFLPDGSIRNDPAYATEDLTDAQRVTGYRDSVQFLNAQLLPIVERILAESRTPPVIILMGDHGLSGDGRFEIFTAIYLPNATGAEVYPGISQVNLFRVTFNNVFNAGYPLLADVSLRVSSDDENPGFVPVPETSPDCMP